MSRRADPDRIHQARRIATRNSLNQHGVPLELAERWCDAWEAEASSRGLERDRDYWQAGALWIADQRSARKLPA